jgi:hypothetical protein
MRSCRDPRTWTKRLSEIIEDLAKTYSAPREKTSPMTALSGLAEKRLLEL